jgi:hypothetical protein
VKAELFMLVWGHLTPEPESWDTERKLVLDFLSARDEVDTWYTCFRDAVFVVSGVPVNTLSAIFHEHFPAARFVVSKVTDNQQGYLPKEAWDFVLEYVS